MTFILLTTCQFPFPDGHYCTKFFTHGQDIGEPGHHGVSKDMYKGCLVVLGLCNVKLQQMTQNKS